MLETDINKGVPYDNYVHVPRIPLVGTMLSNDGIRSGRYQKQEHVPSRMAFNMDDLPAPVVTRNGQSRRVLLIPGSLLTAADRNHGRWGTLAQ